MSAPSSLQSNTAAVLGAGAYSALVETLVCQPFDLVKTRLQLETGKLATQSASGSTAGGGAAAVSSAARAPGMVAVARQVLREGGVRQLYRGVLPELAAVPTTALLFYVNDALRTVFARTGLLAGGPAAARDRQQRAAAQQRAHPHADGTTRLELTLLQATVCGAASGAPEALLLAPFQMVKIRMQSGGEHLRRYTSSWQCAQDVARTEGVAHGLFRGTGATLWRNCTWNGVYFGVISECKNQVYAYARRRGGRGSDSLLSGWGDTALDLVAGTAAGVIATAVNTPFDVAKTRIQSELPTVVPAPASGAGAGAGGVVYRYSYRGGTWAACAHIARAEGWAALYRGFAPKVLRMGIAGGVSIAAYDQALSWFGTGARY